jgi:hypothetical protein
MIVIGGRVRLVNYDMEDAVRLGLTSLPNAAADAAGGLIISDAGGLDADLVASRVSSINTATGTTIPNAIAVVDGVVDDILVDTADMQPKFGTLTNLGSGATIAANLVDIESQTDDIGTAGAGLTAIPWNASWDTEVQSEVQDAIEVNHLDHLLAVDYDPASKPGTATALLNELIESNAGVSRYTAAALAQAPSGTGASASAIADAVWTELIADHSGVSGSTAEALAAAGGAGDPWITSLPGSYTGTQAGKIIADILADTGTDGVVVASGSKTGYSLTATTGLGNQTANITGNLSGSVGSVTSAVTVGSINANAITASALATDAVTEITAGVWNADTATYGAADSFGELLNLLTVPTVGDIADAVWDEPNADHGTPGTTGKTMADILVDTGTSGVVVASGSKSGYTISGTITTLDALNTATPTAVWNAATATYGTAGSYGLLVESLSAAGDPWSVAIPAAYSVGTAGYIVGTYLDAQVSSVSGGGAGLYTVTVTITDSSGDALQGARVNVDGTTQTLTTLTDGIVTFNLDAGSYSLVVSPPAGYATPANTSITVSADASTTIVLTAGSSGVGWLG